MSLGSALRPGLAIVEIVGFGVKVHQVLDLNIKKYQLLDIFKPTMHGKFNWWGEDSPLGLTRGW